MKSVYFTGTEKQWGRYMDGVLEDSNIPRSATIICSDTGKTPPPTEPSATEPTVPEPTKGNKNQGGKQLAVSPAGIIIVILVILNTCTLFLLLKKKKTN